MQKQRRGAGGRVPIFGTGPVDLGVLLSASAAEQAMTPTARMMTAERRGGAADPIMVLARLIAARPRADVDAALLRGCFNAPVAEELTVGQAE